MISENSPKRAAIGILALLSGMVLCLAICDITIELFEAKMPKLIEITMVLVSLIPFFTGTYIYVKFVTTPIAH